MAWELVIDCADTDRMAGFWCSALGYERFGSVGQYRSIVPLGGGSGPKVILQQVSEPKRGKNRLHIDVVAGDIELEAARLMAAGATRVQAEPVQEFGTAWIRMRDPEGNEFCVAPT
jgi:predicted enzyme related to lactoylglutathione lyase